MLQSDLTLLLVLAQIEYKLGNSDRCNALCDAILAQDSACIKAYEMKGDICRHFCQIDQAFFFYHKASESSQGGGAGESSAMSKLGDLYKFQGKMSEAILHYERALTNESNSLSQSQQPVQNPSPQY